MDRIAGVAEPQTRATRDREWDAATYHRVSEPQVAWGERVLGRLELDGEETVVDAGCGTGRLTSRLVARLPRGLAIGVDRSVGMAERAGRTLAGLPARVVTADLLALPLRSASADVVFSTATFHWVRDHDALFAEIARVLRPGGRLHAQCGGGANIAAAHAIAIDVAGSAEFAGSMREFVDPWCYAWPEETQARLSAAGFVEARAWLEPAPTPFDDRESCSTFVASVILRPWLNLLPEAEAKERFVAAVVDRLGEADPPYVLDYWRLNIEARLGS
jgi:trans-aconitate 2-methyltransferase